MLLTLASLAAAATAAPLEPSGKWMVDYRKDMCVASRPFGATTFAIQPGLVMTSTAAKLCVFVPKTRDTEMHRGTATVTLRPSGAVAKLGYTSWIPTGAAVRSYYVQIDAEFGDAMKAASAIDFQMGDTAISLQTGELQPVLSAMRTCNIDLFKSWGITDPGRVSPVGSPADWFDKIDFPWGAKGLHSRITIVLTMAPTGQATGCRVVVSTDSPALDAKTCAAAMTRGRARPLEGTEPRAFVLSVEWSRSRSRL